MEPDPEVTPADWFRAWFASFRRSHSRPGQPWWICPDMEGIDGLTWEGARALAESIEAAAGLPFQHTTGRVP